MHADPPQPDLPKPDDERCPADAVPLLVIPAGSTVTLAPWGVGVGLLRGRVSGVTGWVLETFLIA